MNENVPATEAGDVRDLQFRPAGPADEGRLQAIRRAAFAPVFASFRAILGEELYVLVQQRDDDAQEGLLSALVRGEPSWSLYVAHAGGEIVGFVTIRLDPERHLGEIGLNAVDPERAGKGAGTAMYTFALELMRAAGMKAATVGTGGDPSHAPARRAYEKAGFAVGIPTLWMSREL